MLYRVVCIGLTWALAIGISPSTAGEAPKNTAACDPVEIVSRNDVVYSTASPEPWEAMPVGGGDLSAMVRFDGERLHLHLTKSDAWGFQAPADAPLGTRFFNNVSPGHVRIALGEAGKTLAVAGVSQRLDLYRGRIELTLGSGAVTSEISIWGHPERDVLVVEVFDPQKALGPIDVELSEWRDTMEVTVEEGTLLASEVHTRPAAPHMATSGMTDYFTPETDPLLGRGTAVALGVVGAAVEAGISNSKSATLRIDAEHPDSFQISIACAVTPKVGADPLAEVRRALEEFHTTPLASRREEHEAWWRDYWSKSFLRLESPDGMAQRLTQSYYVHLYTLAGTNRGPVPAKWDGGPGLMRGDERTWGLAEWVQEIRFTYLPLYASNRLEMAKGLTDHYTQMRPFLLEQTRQMWDVPGLWIPETVLPWGGVEDWVLESGKTAHQEYFATWDPDTAPFGKFRHYNQYVGLLFTCGPELAWHYLTYYHYTGDEAYLEHEAYPLIRDMAEFLSHLLRKGDDGRYHLDPANGLETWWMVRDPIDAIDGIRWLFGAFIPLAEKYGKDAELRERCREQLAALPEPSLGLWRADGTIDTSIDVYAAAGGGAQQSRNFENPALYRVYPFGLSGIGTADYDRAVRTFEHRLFPLVQSWSMDALWAARLGLKDQAATILGEHTRKWNRFRYGGWDSENSNDLPGGLSLAPYNDGPGVAFTALHEMLLQSHDGLIRLLPAIADDWSGTYQLRAEGGFLITVSFEGDTVHNVEIQSLLGQKCVLVNPWSGPVIVRAEGEADRKLEGDRVELNTVAGKTYVVTASSST